MGHIADLVLLVVVILLAVAVQDIDITFNRQELLVV